jgi:hypothetical protein
MQSIEPEAMLVRSLDPLHTSPASQTLHPPILPHPYTEIRFPTSVAGTQALSILFRMHRQGLNTAALRRLQAPGKHRNVPN